MTPPAAGPGPVALFPWGEVIEEFLAPLNLAFDDFVEQMSGGWLFGYAAGLRAAGREAIVVCASEAVERPVRRLHRDTGTPIWAVPGRRSGTAGWVRGSPSARALAHWLSAPRGAFLAVLRAERCGAILVQEYEYARLEVLLAAARRLRVPVLATFQGGDVTLSALEGLVRRRSLGACAGLVVASAVERERLAARYPGLRTPVAAIPNPVDVELWRPEPREAARRELGLAPDAFVVLNHGRIDIWRKGLDVLLDAWTSFVTDHPRAQLVLIGSGQDHAAFAAALEERRPARLTWIPSYVTDRVLMRRWLSAADVYLSTSRIEGMPVAPLEAMACGLPVVASDAQGLQDIIERGPASGGLVVPRGDCRAVDAALRRLAADEWLRREVGAAARRRVEQRFSIDSVGRALARFLADPGARAAQASALPA